MIGWILKTKLCCCFFSCCKSSPEGKGDKDEGPGGGTELTEKEIEAKAKILVEKLKDQRKNVFQKKNGLEYIDPSPAMGRTKQKETDPSFGNKSMFPFEAEGSKSMVPTKKTGTSLVTTMPSTTKDESLRAQQFNYEIYGGYNIMRMECCKLTQTRARGYEGSGTQEKNKATFLLNRGVWARSEDESKNNKAWRYFEVDIQNLPEDADMTIGFLDGESYQSFIKNTNGENKYQVGQTIGSIGFSLREGKFIRFYLFDGTLGEPRI